MMPEPLASRYGSAGRPAGGAAPNAPRCRVHPTAAAGWRCRTCGDLCPECAAERRAGTGTIIVCATCGDLAPVIVIPKAHVSFAARIPGAFLYPFNVAGLLSMAALALVMYLLPGTIGRLISLGIFFAYFFSLIVATAGGSDDIEAPEFSDIYEDIITPARRGLTATSLLWIPTLIYIFVVRGPSELTLWDPGLLAIMAASVIYLPMALLVAAAGNGVVRMLNPFFTFRCIGRLGSDYFIAVGAVLGLGVLWLVTSIIAAIVNQLPVPFVSGWLAVLVRLYIPFVTARVLGLLLLVRGADIGYGDESHGLEPVLPDARPRGTLRPAAGAPAPPPRPRAPEAPPESIDLEPSAGDAWPASRGLASAGVGLPLEEAAAPAPRDWPAELRLPDAAPPASAAEVAAALAAGDEAQALERYGRLDAEGRLALPIAAHLALGKAAAGRRDYPLAVRAFRGATEVVPEDADTPRVWALLGRIYADRLGDRATATRVYQHVVEGYPGTEAAAFAAAQLAALTRC